MPDAELKIFGPAIILLIVLLLLALFLAQRHIAQVARDRDLDRVERYIRLCRDKLEAEARSVPDGQSLRELEEIGLSLDVFPPDTAIPTPNPRYVPGLQSVEAWDVVRGAGGQPVSVIRIGRYDSTTRLAMSAIRYSALTGAVGGLLLIFTIWLALRRTIIRGLRRLNEEISSGLPASPPAGPTDDPLEALRASVLRAFSARERQAALHQRLLDEHSEAACAGTADGTLLEVNAAYARLFGRTREELIGSNYLDLIPPSDRTEVVNVLQKLSARDPVSVITHRVVLPDGKIRWVRWRDRAVFDDQGAVQEVLSFGLDVTEEQHLREQGQDLRRAFDQMQSLARTGSLTWNLSADRMEWTDETFRLLGLQSDRTTPGLDRLLETVLSEDRAPLRQLFERARDNGDPFEHEFRAVLADGSVRVLQGRAEVTADPKTKLLNQLTCTLRDITALRDAEAATKRELRLREAIEQSLSAGIVVSDDKGRNLLVNPAFCAMTGWSAEELVGVTPPYPYWPDEELPAITEAFELAIAGKTPPQGFELKFRRKDGSLFDVLVNVAPLLDSNDVHLGWLGAVTDISAIQQTRRELRAAENSARRELLYRQAVDKSITVGLVTIDLEGRPMATNEAYCRMFGYSEAEIMAMGPPYPLWPEAEREKIEQAFALHLAGKCPLEGFSLRFRHKDGHLVDVLITAAPVYDADGRQIGILSALTDITPLQEAQRRLRETNARLQIAQDVAEFGIWDWDPVKDTLHWDRQSFAIFGHPDATDAEAVWRKVQSEVEQERLTYEIRRLIAARGKSGQDHVRARWPDGTLHDILSTYLVVYDAEQRATRVVGINRDVTSELEKERELHDANERLAAALEGGNFGTFEHVFGVGALNWNAVNYEMHGIDASITDPEKLFAEWKEAVGDDYPVIERAVAALPVDKSNFTYDFTVCVRSTGEKRRIRSSIFIERNGQGHPRRLVGVSRRLS